MGSCVGSTGQGPRELWQRAKAPGGDSPGFPQKATYFELEGDRAFESSSSFAGPWNRRRCNRVKGLRLSFGLRVYRVKYVYIELYIYIYSIYICTKNVSIHLDRHIYVYVYVNIRIYIYVYIDR